MDKQLTNTQLALNCLAIEEIVRAHVIRGVVEPDKLVAVVDQYYHPKTPWEMEIYSEAIIYARLGVLN